MIPVCYLYCAKYEAEVYIYIYVRLCALIENEMGKWVVGSSWNDWKKSRNYRAPVLVSGGPLVTMVSPGM